MMYLEERKLVHRDLAARNVLVGDKISGVPVVKVRLFLFCGLNILQGNALQLGWSFLIKECSSDREFVEDLEFVVQICRRGL